MFTPSPPISIIPVVGALCIACSEPIASPPAPDRLVPVLMAPEVIIPAGRIDTISVQLLAANGQPVPGYAVEWSGDGDILPLDAVTDGLGLAHAQWTMPRYPDAEWLPRPIGPSGTFAANATVADLPSVTFTAVAQSFTVEHMDAGGSTGCGVRTGELWCWGATGTGTRDPHAMVLPNGVAATEVQVGYPGVCVLDQSGMPWCRRFWPDAPFLPVLDAPVLVDLDKGAGSGTNSTRFCGRAWADSTPWCWILMQDGPEPSATQESLEPFDVVQAGFDFWCGLDATGAVWCQGDNESGQLGDGTFTNRITPVRVIGLPGVVSLQANATGACAATEEGAIWCWGFGPHGFSSNVPLEITVQGIRGTQLYISETADGFVIHDGEVRGWWGSTWLDYLFVMARHFRAIEVSGGGQTCVRAESGEVFCSWILAIGGGDTSPFPSQLVPLTPVP